MLGGDKGFNDRLSWALVVPLALLAMYAVEVAFMALEVVLEGDEAGSVSVWVVPMMSLAAGWAAVLVGAKVAPDHKPQAALAVAALYMTATLFSGLSRSWRGASAAWASACVVMGAAGCWIAFLQARRLPPDDAPAAGGPT